MEPVKDFESFYAVKILPFLQQLEDERTSAYNWKKFTLFTGAGAFLCFLLNYLKVLPSGIILAGAMLVMCFTGVFFWTKYNDRYIDDFKEKIIRQIITYIYPSAVYKPMGYISKKEYRSSGLYRRRFTHIDGDDYWHCVYNDVAFHCSEIKTWYEDMAGRDNIFKGLFFIANINKDFTGATYVWIKGKAQLASSMADENYRMFPLPPVQKMMINHEDFNRHYSVYTSNTAEASFILSNNMPGHILRIKEKLQKDICFSFVKGKCYIAIPFEENLLEPVTKDLRDKQQIKDYFYSILLIFNIVRKLELNRLV